MTLQSFRAFSLFKIIPSYNYSDIDNINILVRHYIVNIDLTKVNKYPLFEII